MNYVALVKEYAEGGSEWEFSETIKNLKRIKEIYERYDKLDDEKKEKYEEVKEALALEEWARTEIKKNKLGFKPGSPLSADELQVLNALQTTALGREGLIVQEFFKDGPGRNALETLKLRGLVEVIEHWETYSWVPNNTHLGIVGEKYPDNNEDWQDFRDSGASLRMTFSEFLEKRAAGEIKWLSKDLRKYVAENLEKEFKKRYETSVFWINFCGKGLDPSYMYEDIIAGLPAEEVFFNQMVRGFDIEEFESEKIKILDEEFHKKVIDARIEFLEAKKKSLK